MQGPSIEDLRQEVGQNYSGVEDSHFADAGFVAAARDWHEAKTLAEGGFVAKGNTGLQGRYENAEQEFFARLAPMGKDIEDKVMAERQSSGPTAETETPPAQGERPTYGSKEHYDGFKSSLLGKASATDIKARVAAAKGQAKHPSQAAKEPSKTPKARKANAGASVGREKSNDGPAR